MVEEFLRALSGSFARNRTALPAVEEALLVLAALGLALLLARLSRSAWSRRTALHALASRHGIDAAGLALAADLARAEGITPLQLLTRIDLFERATARALAADPAAAPPELAERIHGLRRALGFDRLPVHTPLLTTRELAPGVALELEAWPGQVIHVNEEALWVRLRGDVLPPSPDQELTFDLAHAREARYELRCKARRWREVKGGIELTLAHDEAPRRIQLRDHARVQVRGAIALKPVPPWAPHADLRSTVVARLVDVSAGGALVVSRSPLPVGQLLQATFTLGPARFERLPAVVLAAPVPAAGAAPAAASSHVRLEWGRLPEAERSRLAAAIARIELAGRDDAADRPPA